MGLKKAMLVVSLSFLILCGTIGALIAISHYWSNLVAAIIGTVYLWSFMVWIYWEPGRDTNE